MIMKEELSSQRYSPLSYESALSKGEKHLPASPVLKCSFTFAHTGFVSLDADGNIWKHSQKHLCSLDYLQFSFQSGLGSHELFR